MSHNLHAIKTLVVGDRGVGKKTLEFFLTTGNKWEPHYCYYQNRAINIGSNYIELVDLPGGIEYYHIRKTSGYTASSIIAVFSLADLKTLEAIKDTYLPEIKQSIGCIPPVVLVGTHSENISSDEKEYTNKYLEQVMTELGAQYFRMSVDEQVHLNSNGLLEQVRINSLKHELLNIASEAKTASKTNKAPSFFKAFSEIHGFSSKLKVARIIQDNTRESYDSLSTLQLMVLDSLNEVNNPFAQKAIELINDYGEIPKFPISQNTKSANNK